MNWKRIIKPTTGTYILLNINTADKVNRLTKTNPIGIILFSCLGCYQQRRLIWIRAAAQQQLIVKLHLTTLRNSLSKGEPTCPHAVIKKIRKLSGGIHVPLLTYSTVHADIHHSVRKNKIPKICRQVEIEFMYNENFPLYKLATGYITSAMLVLKEP